MSCNSTTFCEDKTLMAFTPCLTPIYKGLSDYEIKIQLVNKDKTAFDTTGYEIYVALKDSRDIHIIEYSNNKDSIQVLDNGVISFNIRSITTNLFLTGYLYGDVHLRAPETNASYHIKNVVLSKVSKSIVTLSGQKSVYGIGTYGTAVY